ncbi:hypothetical protein T484DRAFT_1886770 [Baffinella frigidus]|nr:hypothetical protein T484DRAFT_1886770 [Cryptophyta sp. CCMP2293]
MGVTVTIEGKGVRGGQEGPAGAWLGEALTAGLRVWPGRLLVVESVRTHAGDIAVEVVVGAAETIEDAAPAELCADLAILWAAFLRGEGAWAGPGHTGDPMRVAPAILDVQIHPPRAYPAQGTLRGVGDGEGEGGPLPRLLAVTVKHARALQECRGVGERVFAILRCAGGEAFRTSSVGLQSGPTFEQSAAARETQAMKGVALTVEVWSEGEGGGEDLAGSVNISAAKIADMAESGISFWFPLDAASPEAGPSILLAVTLALPSAPLPTAAMAPLPAARPPPLPGPASDPTSAGFGLRNHHPSGTASGGKQPASGVSGPAGRGTFGRKFGTQQAEGAAGGANKVAPVGETAARWNAVPSDLPEVRIDARDPLAPRGTVWSIAPLPEEGVFAVAGLGSEISVCRLEGAEWRRVRGLDGHDAPALANHSAACAEWRRVRGLDRHDAPP